MFEESIGPCSPPTSSSSKATSSRSWTAATPWGAPSAPGVHVGPLAGPIPYTQDTERILHGLADLNADHRDVSRLGLPGRRATADGPFAIWCCDQGSGTLDRGRPESSRSKTSRAPRRSPLRRRRPGTGLRGLGSGLCSARSAARGGGSAALGRAVNSDRRRLHHVAHQPPRPECPESISRSTARCRQKSSPHIPGPR